MEKKMETLAERIYKLPPPKWMQELADLELKKLKILYDLLGDPCKRTDMGIYREDDRKEIIGRS